MLLSLVQENIRTTQIVSGDNWAENITGTWHNVTVLVSDHDLDNELKIVSPYLDGELGEAEDEIKRTASFDNLTIEFILPCNFDALDEPGYNYIVAIILAIRELFHTSQRLI